MVWLTQGRYWGKTAIDMHEDTKKELRSIGYIQ
jgi:hypothetical protein